MAKRAEGNGEDGKVFDIRWIGSAGRCWRGVSGGFEDDVSRR